MLYLKGGLQDLENEGDQLVAIDFWAAQREEAVRRALAAMYTSRLALGAEVVVGTLQTLVARARDDQMVLAAAFVAVHGSLRLTRNDDLLAWRVGHREHCTRGILVT